MGVSNIQGRLPIRNIISASCMGGVWTVFQIKALLHYVLFWCCKASHCLSACPWWVSDRSHSLFCFDTGNKLVAAENEFAASPLVFTAEMKRWEQSVADNKAKDLRDKPILTVPKAFLSWKGLFFYPPSTDVGSGGVSLRRHVKVFTVLVFWVSA